MKKLMFAAATVAVAGGAFSAPLVYDYKASVKHMYLKKVSVKLARGSVSVYQKFQKSSSLKGFLIQDFDGATSATIQAEKNNQASVAPECADYGRNRAFLVVINSSVEKGYKLPKVLPACIDAKFIDTKFSSKKQANSGLAEGILYVGGDAIKGVRPQIDDINDGAMEQAYLKARSADFWTQTLPDAKTPGMIAYSDYVWTSVYLFGRYNGPNWYAVDNGADAKVIPFPDFEYAWDQNLPTTLQRGVDQATGGVDFDGDGDITKKDVFDFYHDTWMNGTGFGKYMVPAEDTFGEVCCGLDEVNVFYRPMLESLSGNVKGGLFICTENGIDAQPGKGGSLLPAGTYDFFDLDQHRWEDQFVTYRLETATTYANDGWQNDLWQDGAVDQATTDVIVGTWSIKWNKKFFNVKNPIYKAVTIVDMELLNAIDGNIQNYEEAADGLEDLVGSIKGAVLNLDKNAKFIDGTEIYKYKDGSTSIPVITPQFAKYYGLANWK